MTFDGLRALIVGDYVTPTTGPFAGQLGPWSDVVSAAGVAPRSAMMKIVFVIFGVTWLSVTTGFLLRARRSAGALAVLAVATLWYLPIGTLVSSLVLIGLAILRMRSNKPLQPTSGAVVVTALAMYGSQAAPSALQNQLLPFSCVTFGPDVDETALKVRFGDANVTTGLVPWGGAEGDRNEGTILFADRPDARLEIYWKDQVAKRTPEWVGIHGSKSRWRSPGGVTLGLDLKTVERLNRRPFRLAGWGSDLGGGLYTWAGGLLERQDVGGCRIGFRFNYSDRDHTPEAQALHRQVMGEREYSSGHPAMQTLNPRIDDAVIVNRPRQDDALTPVERPPQQVLPASLQSTLDRLHPGWRVAGLSVEVRQEVGNLLGPTPNVITGDFDGNGRPDIALLVEYLSTDQPEKSFTHYVEALAFLNTDRGFVQFKLRNRSPAPNPDLYLTLQHRGAEGFDFKARKKFIYPHDSIGEWWSGKGGGTYIYGGGRFRRVTESDWPHKALLR